MTQPFDIPTNMQRAITQLYPTLVLADCVAWCEWLLTQPDYYLNTVRDAGCVTKVYNQFDPPWLRVAQEVVWWGTGRDAVRTLARGMDWARLQGATHYGYSLAPRLDIIKWRVL